MAHDIHFTWLKPCLAGDTIEFTFQLPSYVKNGTNVQHTATQSTFEAPCTPKEGGYDTGLQTTTMTGGKSFTLLVRPLFQFALTFGLNEFTPPLGQRYPTFVVNLTSH